MTPTSGDSDSFRTLDQNIEEAVVKLRHLFGRESAIERDMDKERTNPVFKEEFGEEFRDDLARIQSRIKQKLTDLLCFPPHFASHFARLSNLAKDRHTRERLVFIMTKFPEGESKLDGQLKNVIETMRECIEGCGYIPLMADNRRDPMLWANVELHLLACPRGVALLEDRYRPELNPNVTMEWGWMRGMGKDVLPVVEAGFGQLRADLAGLIKLRFDWDNPKAGISEAIEDWLLR